MKIEMLFPELCNLYGEMSNVEYLKKSVPEAEIIVTGAGSEPYFVDETPDLIYMGCMTESSQELVLNLLSPYTGRIRELIDSGARFLITGNAIELFGKYIENDDGSKIPCLGIFDVYAKRKMMSRFNGLYLGTYQDIEIVGFKSQFTHLYGNDEAPLFSTIQGVGRNPDFDGEGIHKNGFMATYLLGPLLILNPIFTRRLLKDMGWQGMELAYEDAAMRAYMRRVKEFHDDTTIFGG